MTPEQASLVIDKIKYVTTDNVTLHQLIKKDPVTQQVVNVRLSLTQIDTSVILSFLVIKKYTPKITHTFLNADGSWRISFDITDFPAPEEKDEGRDDRLLYEALLNHYVLAKDKLTHFILDRLAQMLPADCRDEATLKRILKWDFCRQSFDSQYSGLPQLIFEEMGIDKHFTHYSSSDKYQQRKGWCSFNVLSTLHGLANDIKDAEDFSEKTLRKMAKLIQSNLCTVLQAADDNWSPSEFTEAYDSLREELQVELRTLDFSRLVKIDIDQFIYDLEDINFDYYGQITDYTKHVVRGNTAVGLSEAKGKRDDLEDALACDHESVALFPELRPYYQWQALQAAFLNLQETCGKRNLMGSTLCMLITWRKANSATIITGNSGDSSACYAVIDPLTQTVKSAGRLNNLHNPDERVNPQEKSRVDHFCQLSEEKPSEKGRLGNGLALSRCFGDAASKKFGHIFTPETQFHEIELAETDLLYAWVGCDGVFEPRSLTPQSGARLILEQYRNMTVDELAKHIVQTALNAGSTDNCSVALTKVGREVISLSVMDGHGPYDESYLLAHDLRLLLYFDISKAAEIALQAQNNPQSYIPAPNPPASHHSYEDKGENLDFPRSGMAWDMTVCTLARPYFKDPRGKFAIKVSGSHDPNLYYCHLRTFEEALHLFNFLVHISCQDSTLMINYNPQNASFYILITRFDYLLLAKHMSWTEPHMQAKKSRDLIHPRLLGPNGLFSAHPWTAPVNPAPKDSKLEEKSELNSERKLEM